jgi:hypothetical protein
MIGYKFKLKREMLGNPEGTVGVVFNDYGTGVQIIFPNGEYDGFDKEEQELFLTPCGIASGRASHCQGYVFRNVIQVSRDFGDGYWTHAFVEE